MIETSAKSGSPINSGDADPVQVPKGRAFALLAALVTVLSGHAYKQNELPSAGTPVLRVGNLFTSNSWYFSTLKFYAKGGLIFAWSASFGPFIWDGEKAIYRYRMCKIPLHGEADLDKRYLHNFLLQKTREFKEAGHGISMIRMTKEKKELLEVPLSPDAQVPVSTVHTILRNRLCAGDFDWNGRRFTGRHTAIVSRELWQQVQDVLDGRHARKTRRGRDDFAFSGLVTCWNWPDPRDACSKGRMREKNGACWIS